VITDTCWLSLLSVVMLQYCMYKLYIIDLHFVYLRLMSYVSAMSLFEFVFGLLSKTN